MAGKKQHYIPQFLLRAFGRERKQGQFQVRAHFPDRTFVTATHGVAAEREFYSVVTTDIDSLDGRITSAESEYANLHRDLLAAPTPNPNAAARLLTHLMIRGAHFRDSATYLAGSMIEMMVDAFSDPSTFRRMLGLAGPQPTGPFKKTLNEKYNEFSAKLGRMPISRYEFQMLGHRMAQDRFDELFAENLVTAQVFSEMVLPDLRQTAADGQRKALEADFEPEKRVSAYERLNWAFSDEEEPNFILPDSVAVTVNEDGEAVAPIYVDTSEEALVCFPLSARRLLIGSRNAGRPVLDSATFNEMAAAVSWDLFISHPESEVSQGLEAKIRLGLSNYIAKFISALLATTISDAMAEAAA